MAANRKEWAKLIKEVERQGWTVQVTKGGHLKWVAPNGKTVYSAYSASDPRSLLNHKRQLRVNGFIQLNKKGK